MNRLAAAASMISLATAPIAAQAPAPAPTAGSTQIVLSRPPAQGGLVSGTAPPGTVALALDGRPVRLAGDGRFILGFDRDQGPRAMLEARLADGRTLQHPITVAPRRWAIERISLPRRLGVASEEFQRRRERELARIAAARAVEPMIEGWRQIFIWPARGRISGVFGSQRIYRGWPAAFHSGVDIAAGAGAAVVAPADGLVVLAGPPAFSLEGKLVIVAHGMGLNSAFLHLSSVDVREGQVVRQGQRLGAVGATGRATGPHLHWSMKWHDARIDPQMLAGIK
jgi:murein DD-endopeptidase MepM/ murein hydrolase activator NlpD